MSAMDAQIASFFARLDAYLLALPDDTARIKKLKEEDRYWMQQFHDFEESCALDLPPRKAFANATAYDFRVTLNGIALRRSRIEDGKPIGGVARGFSADSEHMQAAG